MQEVVGEIFKSRDVPLGCMSVDQWVEIGQSEARGFDSHQASEAMNNSAILNALKAMCVITLGQMLPVFS